LFAAHIRDFARLPDLDEQGKKELQQYIQRLVAPMNEALQLVLDREVEIGNYFIELLPSDYEKPPNLVAAIEALKALHERVLPTSDFQGQVSMDLEGMVEWANRLETGKQYAFLAYLFWASDIVSMTPFPK